MYNKFLFLFLFLVFLIREDYVREGMSETDIIRGWIERKIENEKRGYRRRQKQP